jgi:tocopherol O-methyltransferase
VIASNAPLTGEAVAEHYDELDHFYREIWGEHVHHGLWLCGDESSEQATRQLVQAVAERAQIRRGSRVCDIGCGYGATARMLARESGAEVTALTISPAQFGFARSVDSGKKGVRYVLGDWLQNELPNEAFDAAIAIESSEHMTDKSAFFAQAQRVLRSGGRFVVCAWLAKENAKSAETRFLLEPICREGRMPGMGTESDYRRFLESAGFMIERVDDVSAQVKKTWPICVGRFLVRLLREPRYARFLFSQHRRNRIFALTIFRIWIAYNTGAMRYGIFTAQKK